MNIRTLLIAAASLQFLAAGVFLMLKGRENRTANRLLAVFLIAKAVCWGEGILADDWPFIVSHPFCHALALSADLLLGPSLYLYAKLLMFSNFRLKQSHWIHALPFGLYLLALTAALLLSPDLARNWLFSDSPATIALYSATYLQFLGYSTACLLDLRKHERRLKSVYSSIESRNLSWLFFLVSGFVVIWLMAYVNFLAEALRLGSLVPWEFIILAVFVFANGIIFRGPGQPEGIAVIPEGTAVSKYARTALSDEKRVAYLSVIQSVMRNDRLYLDPEMTLDHLSRKTSIPAHHVSQVLNVELRQNFFDFVNAYRVEACKSRLKTDSDRTVLQVLFDAGFNSKSSFHRAFRKHTGMTPSQFRKTA